MDQKKAGVLLSYGQTVLSTVISLVYTPVMLRLLGQSEYGLYTLVNGFISNLALMSFGLGSAYMRYYARFEASEGERGVAKINGMFMVIFLVIGAMSLVVGGVLVANVHNIFAAKLTPKELDTARILMALLVVNTPGLLSFLPFLMIGGLVFGAITGVCADRVMKYMRHMRL